MIYSGYLLRRPLRDQFNLNSCLLVYWNLHEIRALRTLQYFHIAIKRGESISAVDISWDIRVRTYIYRGTYSVEEYATRRLNGVW